MIKVEHNIPIPKKNSGQPAKYPLRTMRKGDSFFVKGKKAGQLTGATVRIEKELGYKFTFREMNGGVRVWRMK